MKEDMNKIVELLEKSKRGEINLSYSADCGSRLQFHKDGKLEVDYGGSLIEFVGDFMEFFNVRNDSP